MRSYAGAFRNPVAISWKADAVSAGVLDAKEIEDARSQIPEQACPQPTPADKLVSHVHIEWIRFNAIAHNLLC